MLWIMDWLIYLVGLFQLVYLLDYVINSAKTLTSKADLSVYGRGSWALVTACTDGIGRGFVRELAKEGFNIILVSRNPEKLNTEASYLRETYGVETLIVVKDCSECHKNPIDFFTDLYEQVKSKDISIVVNNIGAGLKKLFHSSSFQQIETFNSLNLWPIAFISRLIIPDMLKRKQKGAIINLGSIASELYSPFSAVYSGGKAFDKKLSLISRLDLDSIQMNNPGIDVLFLMPGLVDTPLGRTLDFDFLKITANECARGALNCIGKIDTTNGHWKHILSRQLFAIVLSPLMLRVLIRGREGPK